MKTAVIYARYSSENQTEQSIEGQLRICQEYAKTHDILILDTYIDRAMTGTNDNRPDFQRMIKDSQKKEWDYVIVYKLDRFSRNKYEMAMHKKTLKDNGTKLLSAMEYIPDSPEAIIIESMLEGYAEYYSAELSQKVKRGMRETRLKGNFQGGTLTYGYKLDGRKIVIDEQKAEIVKYVFNRYAHGKCVNEIIKELTLHGVQYKGKPIPQNLIYNMLKNEKYTGIYKRNDEVYENMFPKIIEHELFEKVRAKRRKNLYGKRSTRAVYLLRNKLGCGYCGNPIRAESGTSEHGKRINYYKCIGIKKYHNGCIKETIRQDVLENLVIETIIKELSKKENIDRIVKNLVETQKSQDQNSELKRLLKIKKQAENTLNNIMIAIEQGIINKTTNKRMKELENQIEELERQILIEKNKNNLQIGEDDIRKYYTKALQQEPAMLIEYLIQEIKMFNDKIEITFNNPINKGPRNSGLFLLLDTYHKSIIQNRNENKQIDIKIELYI